MTPRERVFAVLEGHRPDRVPRFEIWIDALVSELGCADATSAYAALGQDGVMIPTRNPPGSRAWRDGVDEWGRAWRKGTYVTGVVDTWTDLARYNPPSDYAKTFYEPERVWEVRRAYPEHALIFGTHAGPLTGAYMAMGFERFFVRLVDDLPFVRRLLETRTRWCIALYQEALRLGAEVLILGDDAGRQGGPMISPQMWREYILPCHRQIVEALDAPVIWHSDGDVEALLPMAIEAGFAGVHGLDPIAAMDLARIRRQYSGQLTLIGNVDVRVLFGSDLGAVRCEVDRCMRQGSRGTEGGGYMIASCNSISAGMNPAAVAEMFRYQKQATWDRSNT
jgi:uroporphyrinogen decarboxylase